jgi:hypothetical protein
MRKSQSYVSLVVVAVALSASYGQGGTLYRGKVSLPFEVSWGSAVLPAGEYHLVMTSLGDPLRVLDAQGRMRALVFGSADAVQPMRPTALLVTNEGAQRTVRSFNCPEWGYNFVYRSLTRAERNRIAFGDPATAVSVRVASR